MRTSSILAVFFFIATASVAQTFSRRQVIPLPERLSKTQLFWVSSDTDTLLDLVLTGSTIDSQFKIVSIQNTTLGPFVVKTTAVTGMKTGFTQLADWNRDNRVDVIVSGKTAINTDAVFPFVNTGNSTFQKQAQKLLEHAGVFRIGELNNDGAIDLVTVGNQNGQPFLRVFENTNGLFNLRMEQLGITTNDIRIFDLNNDGWNDLVVSGQGVDGKPFVRVYQGALNFKFRILELRQPVQGKISLADVNADGAFDIIGIGTNADARQVEVQWLNKKDSFAIASVVTAPRFATIETGDMTSDGKSDEWIWGIGADSRTVNFVREPSNVMFPVDTTSVQAQVFGDRDRDGDLDIAQVIDSLNVHWLKYYENTTARKNLRPKAAKDGFAISTGDKTFIFWSRGNDDRTDSLSLTYDVELQRDLTSVVSSSFDNSNGRRSIVTHGNAGTNRSMMIRDLPDGRYSFFIQTVDNAYNGSYSLCTGGVVPCFDLKRENLEACQGASVKLPSGGGTATWYSAALGFLGKSDTLRFVATTTDTLYAFIPQQLDCSKNKIFALHVNPQPPTEKEIIYACRQQVLTLAIPAGWKNATWNTTPPVSGSTSIQVTVTAAQIIKVQASGLGCTYKKDFDIRISEPTVAIEGDGFQIMKGTSVQLTATGTASTWQWSPVSGLDNAAVSNPTATPTKTTEYILTGTDSVGCTATARTTIIVQETAFVPNLFTPNGDGKNDSLLIYGLTSPNRFVFRVFNREGSLVYETKDVSQATTIGWNGYVQGTLQPGGLYYWRVDGETGNGDKLLLNGKTSGSILLLH